MKTCLITFEPNTEVLRAVLVATGGERKERVVTQEELMAGSTEWEVPSATTQISCKYDGYLREKKPFADALTFSAGDNRLDPLNRNIFESTANFACLSAAQNFQNNGIAVGDPE